MFQVINLQRSKHSSRERILFTINLGVASKRLLALERHPSDISTVKEYECHWRERLDSLCLDEINKWWEVDHASVLTEVGTGLILRRCFFRAHPL